MRVVFFLPHLRSGGSQLAPLRIANALAADGVTVDLVLVRAVGEHLADIGNAVNVIDLTVKHAFLGMRKLRAFLASTKVDCIFSVQGSENIASILVARTMRTRPRVVIGERTLLSARLDVGEFRAGMAMLARRLFYPLADLIVPVSRAVGDDLMRHTGVSRSLIRPIYNPIDSGSFLQRASEPFDHPFLHAAGPLLVSVGRLEAQKDYPTLLQAFAIVRQGIDARLIVVGEGTQRAELTAQIESFGIGPFVDLVGFHPNPASIVARADLFVLSSRYEGLPNAMIEALCCGRPIVSTAFRGAEEILGEGEYGLTAPVGDARQLADRILAMIASPTSAERLRERCALFEPAKIVAAYREAFHVPSRLRGR